MNGKLSAFHQIELMLPSPRELIVQQIANGLTESVEEAEAWYVEMLTHEVFDNGEYQVQINENPRHSFSGSAEIWHLTIKRHDREPIHDWRDLQAIKNMLVGRGAGALSR